MELKEILDEFLDSVTNNTSLRMSPTLIEALSDDGKVLKFIVYLSSQVKYITLFTSTGTYSETKQEILSLLNDNDDMAILEYLKYKDDGKYFLILKYISLVNKSMYSVISPILDIARKSLTKNV